MEITSTASSSTGSSAQAESATAKTGFGELGTQDFVRMLVSELSNQDPFEPMKNQDIINQIGAIRNLESNDQLTKTLKSLSEQNSTLNETMKGLLLQGNLSSAGGLIGQVVLGVGPDGQALAGKVVGVSANGGTVSLVLESGKEMSLDSVNRVVAPDQLKGMVVSGTTAAGRSVVGMVADVLTNGSNAILQLDSGQQVPLSSVSGFIAPDQLKGQMATGLTADGQQVTGLITSVVVEDDSVMLELDNGNQVNLNTVTMLEGGA